MATLKQKAILIVGIWVAILPFLGFPSSWKRFFFFLSGLLLIYIAYLLHREGKRPAAPKTYVDNRDAITLSDDTTSSSHKATDTENHENKNSIPKS